MILQAIFANNNIINTIQPSLETDELRYNIRMENVVNMQTIGYKELKMVILLDEAKNEKQVVVYRDFKDGTFLNTNDYLDLAIEGDAFFVIETPFGTGYTKDGRFMIDGQGRLLTRTDYYPVIGVGGLVVLPDSQVSFSTKGEIYKDFEIIDQLKIVSIQNKKDLISMNGVNFLEPTNKDLFILAEANYQLRQGWLEQSNVNTVQQLAQMASKKTYELRSKVLQMELQRISKAADMLK